MILPDQTHSVAALVLAAMLAPLAGCTTPEMPKPAVATQAVIQKPGQKTIRVSSENSGASIVLEPSQQLVVSLALKVGTRLEWSLVDLKPGVLAVQSSRFEWSSRPADFDAGIGVSIWQLKVDAPGSVVLKFDLRRPHSLDPAQETVTYDVTVK